MVRFRGYICNLFLLMQSEYVGLFAAQQWNRFLLIVVTFFPRFYVIIILDHLLGFKSLREQGKCGCVTFH